MALILVIAVFDGTAQARSQWILGLNLTTRYDTNIQNTARGQTDVVYIVGSSVGMNYQGSNVDLSGMYNLGVELFTTHHDLNHAAQGLTLSGDLSRMMAPVLPKKSTLHFTEALAYTPNLSIFGTSGLGQTQPGTSLIPGAPTVDLSTSGVSTPRSNAFRQAFTLNNTTPISRLTSLTVSYSNAYSKFQDPSLVDGWTNGVSLSVRHDVSRIDTLNADIGYRRFNPYGGGVSNTYSLNGGDTHKFSPVSIGSANLGVVAAVYPSQNQPQYIASGHLAFAKKISENLKLDATATRDFNTGSGIGRIPLVQNYGDVSLIQRFTQLLQAKVLVTAARNYSLGGGESNKTNILSRGVNLTLTYEINSWLESTLGYSYYRQESFESSQPNLSRDIYYFSLRGIWS